MTSLSRSPGVGGIHPEMPVRHLEVPFVGAFFASHHGVTHCQCGKPTTPAPRVTTVPEQE